MVAARKSDRRKRPAGAGRFAHTGRGWKLEDAKARFSEVVRLARSEGPQRVSVRGKDAVVIMSVEELERLAPKAPQLPLVAFLEGLKLSDLEMVREPDHGRNVDL
ncbi:MAG: type II toxin-antitoxin system Phd/YefM family antitoxin [Sphingobium sp.]